MLSMLICVGGFPGSGRSRLCKALSASLRFYEYPVPEVKHTLSIEYVHKITASRSSTPYSDELLLQVYKKIVADFQLLSKMHAGLIVSDVFYRNVPRELLFNESEKYFGNPLIVWAE